MRTWNFKKDDLQRDLAKQVGCSESFISLVLRGLRTPSVKTAIKLYRATGIKPVNWIFPKEFKNPLINASPRKG